MYSKLDKEKTQPDDPHSGAVNAAIWGGQNSTQELNLIHDLIACAK